MPIQRNLQAKSEELLNNFPVLAILGARQCGKTTFTKQLKPDWKYFDLENPNDFEVISRDPVFFFEQFPQHLILDEAQDYPEIFKTLRGVIDSDRTQKGRFIITGSSSPDLLNHISETLAGRIAIIKMDTLKANEACLQPLSEFYEVFYHPLDRKNLIEGPPRISNSDMQKIWLTGGYPEPVLQNQPDYYAQWMQQYRDTYINRDLSKLFPRLNKFAYQQFLSMLSKLSGTIINKAELSRAIDVSQPTIAEYLHITTGTFLWRSIPSFSSNRIKSLIKMPKGHMRDSGILHYLLKISDMDSLITSPNVGLSFEGFVIEEILKGLEATSVINWEQYYYRTSSGAEIDLILHGPFGLLPIEIKHGSTVKTKQLQALAHFIQEFECPFGIVINQASETRWLTPQIYQIPVGWL